MEDDGSSYGYKSKLFVFSYNVTLNEVIGVTKRERMSNRHGRLGVLLLAAALVCALLPGFAQAAPSEGGSATLNPAAPKPLVTIQGNVVVNKGKPTGFYELALCVRTARTVTRKADGAAVAEADYAKALAAALESGKPEDRQALDDTYNVTYYPFQSAAAAVHINLDALTAVTWGTGKPIYEDWDGVNYPTKTNTKYPRGIDLDDTDQPDIFTDLEPIKNGARAVRLDTAKPDEVTNATALVEKVTGDDALLTLSANTTTTANVIYETPTPVVVVRFAYDMNRFTELEVGDPRDPVNVPNESNFWAGLDVNDRLPADAARTALTYLGARDASSPTDPYAVSDAQAAGSSVFQSVWVAQNMLSDDKSQATTQFYYYLGAEHCSASGQKNIRVYQEALGTESTENLYVPKTAGSVVLATRNAAYATPGDPEAAGGNASYSFFQNLLRKADDTLRVELVNAETYRKPTGGGGITILFYDWDDSLIGSLIVDGGDVRSMVEEYVEENLVHPDLRPSAALTAMGGKLPDGGNYTTADQLAYQTLTNSLARDYTYRGKYAYTVGDEDLVGDDGDPVNKARANGEDYPLTNKLDYVFTKRVNTEFVQNGERYVLPHKVTDADMVDAALYPYAYGWAVVEDSSAKRQKDWKVMYDAKKLEDTWTTIGVGELSSVDPDYYDNAGADKALPTPTAADEYVAPAFLVDEDPYWADHVNEKPQPGATYTNKYAYSLNSNGSESYFRFADFSDIDAELARYTKKNGAPKDTLIVKATYEPGEDLREGSYRMIEEPYFNKMNDKTASTGGAYSAKVVFERSNTATGNVRGVQRTRSPMVRQDTTTDYKWLVSDDPAVDHDLNNADVATAKSRNETTFTKVDVDNGDEIVITLSLSARMNNVDYFIVETYNYNFVAGPQRTDSNIGKPDGEWIPDNYNYRTEDSVDGIYYNCDYETREGSRGFVLYGTLNSIMQQATLIKKGEVAESSKNTYISYQNMQDANLRANRNGDVAAILNQATLQNAILQAANDILTNHKGDPDYWNDDLNCAELTYHQLQWYILDGVLLDRDTADDENHKLSFCHLHAACADLVSNKPKTWADVMEAAAQRDADRLKQLSFDELRDMTHLRNNANGGDFSSRDVMINRLINAVNGDAALTDWVDVQKALLNGNGDVDTYWWYDGSTANTAPGNWDAMLDRVTPAITPQDYPDGVSRTTNSKLASIRSLFDANAAAGPNNATRQWINVTHNLVRTHREEQVEVEVNGEVMQEWHYIYAPLTDFNAFITSLVETVETAQAGGFGIPSWEAVQYHILFPGEPLDFINEPWNNVKLLNTSSWDPDANPPPKQWPEGFWWKDGNIPLTVDNTYTLLEAMKLLNGDDEDDQKRAEDALQTVTWERLEGDGFWLRSSKTGDRWTTADTPKTGSLTKDEWKVFQDAQKNGAYNWNTLQYYLIHKGDPDPPDLTDRTKINGEAYYYWWRNGGTGTAVDFSKVVALEDVFLPLFRASIRASEFGDPAAADSVEKQLADGSFYKLTHLTTSDLATTQAAQTLTDLTWFTDTDALLVKMNQLMKFMQTQQSITDPYTLPEVNWYQAQHWLLTGNYITYGTDDYNKAVEDYWWYDKDKKPVEEVKPEPTEAYIIPAMEDYLNNGTLFTKTLTSLNDCKDSGIRGKTQTTNLTIVAFRNFVKNLADDIKGNPAYFADGKVTISWLQIQYYAATAHKSVATCKNKGTLAATPEEAFKKLISEFGYDPANFPANVQYDPAWITP